jgi:hypothetical protein
VRIAIDAGRRPVPSLTILVAEFKVLNCNLVVGGPRLPISRRVAATTAGGLHETKCLDPTEWRSPMKTLVSVLTAGVLLAGIGAASALDQQTTNAELDNQLNHEFTVPHAYASARVPHAYASARTPSPVVMAPSMRDFQLDGGRN